MLTRRQFLIGFGSGLILPDWLLRAQQYLRNEGQPLLEPPLRVKHTLSTLEDGSGGHTLYLDHDPGQVIRFTWREMIERYQLTGGEPIEDYDWSLRQWGFQGQLDEFVDDMTALEFWCEREGPSVKAFELLENLPLGDSEDDSTLYGGLCFTHGFHPGDWTPHVIAEDDLTLSLLQKKLNDLGLGIDVVPNAF